MGDNPFQVFVDLQRRFPVLGDAYFYAAVPALLVVTFIGRFWLRALVNRRVKSIGIDGGAFLSLDQMRKRGLINEDEYKGMRRKMAERQMKEMTAQPTLGRDAADVLMAIQANPELAKTMLQPSDELVRRSLAGLGKKHADDEVWEPAPGVVVGAYPGTEAALAAKMGRGSELVASAPAHAVLTPGQVDRIVARAAHPSPATLLAATLAAAPLPIEDWDSFNPGDPLSDPRLNAQPEPPAPAQSETASLSPAASSPLPMTPPMQPPPAQAAPTRPARPAAMPAFAPPPRKKGGSAPMDIDALLEKGLISREEYDRLNGLMNQI